MILLKILAVLAIVVGFLALLGGVQLFMNAWVDYFKDR
jgi:hypothetical protein